MQNSEQGEGTLWKRVIARSSARSADELYKLYSAGVFNTLEVDATEVELSKFVAETKIKGPKFSNYPSTKLNQFLDRIYELRKDNTNNPT